MAVTQLIPNNYRLRNAISFVNSFNSAVNTVSASITGTLTSGNAWITSISSNTGISVGQLLTSNIASAIPTGTTVASVNSSTIVMSSQATSSGSAVINSYVTSTSGYYMFAGSSKPWSSGVVPQYYDNPSTVNFNVYNNMIFGKSIQASDVSLMVHGTKWVSGSIYDMYDDADIQLSSKQFYVYTYDGTYYYVWKCLNNNNNGVSSYSPLYIDMHAGDSYYQTADGYQWKYMYRFTNAIYNKFATSVYIPVVIDANVVTTAVSGAIDVIVPVDSNNNIVSMSGSGYNNYHNGTFSSVSVVNTLNPLVSLDSTASKSNNFYTGCYLYVNGGTGAGQYKSIINHISNNSGIYVTLASQFTTVPDNTSTYLISPAIVIKNSSDEVVNAAAIAIVNSTAGNSISQIVVLNRGQHIYSAYANVIVSSQVGVTNAASVRVISGPKGGHGSNAAAELYCSTVGISTTFANSESNTITTYNDYQTVGILKDPLFSNVVFTTTNSVGTFTVGEKITQTIGNVTSTAIVTVSNPLQVTNATGGFMVSPNSSVGYIVGSTSSATAQIVSILNNNVVKGFKTFNQLYSYNGSYTQGTSFTQNEIVYQNNITVSNAIFHSNNASGTTVYLTSKLGPIYSSNTLTNNSGSTIFNINTKYGPDLVPESGDVIYIENFDAVNRSNTQSETIKLILQY